MPPWRERSASFNTNKDEVPLPEITLAFCAVLLVVHIQAILAVISGYIIIFVGLIAFLYRDQAQKRQLAAARRSFQHAEEGKRKRMQKNGRIHEWLKQQAHIDPAWTASLRTWPLEGLGLEPFTEQSTGSSLAVILGSEVPEGSLELSDNLDTAEDVAPLSPIHTQLPTKSSQRQTTSDHGLSFDCSSNHVNNVELEPPVENLDASTAKDTPRIRTSRSQSESVLTHTPAPSRFSCGTTAIPSTVGSSNSDPFRETGSRGLNMQPSPYPNLLRSSIKNQFKQRLHNHKGYKEDPHSPACQRDQFKTINTRFEENKVVQGNTNDRLFIEKDVRMPSEHDRRPATHHRYTAL